MKGLRDAVECLDVHAGEYEARAQEEPQEDEDQDDGKETSIAVPAKNDDNGEAGQHDHSRDCKCGLKFTMIMEIEYNSLTTQLRRRVFGKVLRKRPLCPNLQRQNSPRSV